MKGGTCKTGTANSETEMQGGRRGVQGHVRRYLKSPATHTSSSRQRRGPRCVVDRQFCVIHLRKSGPSSPHQKAKGTWIVLPALIVKRIQGVREGVHVAASAAATMNECVSNSHGKIRRHKEWFDPLPVGRARRGHQSISFFHRALSLRSPRSIRDDDS